MLENITGEELKNQFKTNKKLRLITLIVGSAALLALGYFIYLQFVWTPKNEESKGKYWPGLNLAAADSTDAAIEALRPIKKKIRWIHRWRNCSICVCTTIDVQKRISKSDSGIGRGDR